MSLDNELRRLLAQDDATAPKNRIGEGTEDWRVEDLLAYVRGELDPEATERLLGTLAQHPEAMDLLLEIRALESTEVGPANLLTDGGFADELGDAEVRERTGQILAQLPPDPRREVATFRPRNSGGYRFWLPWAAAALLGVALGLFALHHLSTIAKASLELELALAELRSDRDRIAQLEGALAETATRSSPTATDVGGAPAGNAPQPYISVPIVDLFPDAHLRSSDVSTAIDLPPSGLMTFILTPADPEPERRYRLEILAPDARSVWSGDAEADASGALVVVVPRELLEVGRWRFRLAPVGHGPSPGDGSPGDGSTGDGSTGDGSTGDGSTGNDKSPTEELTVDLQAPR